MAAILERAEIDVTPSLAVKDVILCRSGYQDYSYADVLKFGLGEPRVRKETYRMYRPAPVLIANMEKMVRLPITKEHTVDWVNAENYQRLAHGQSGTKVEVVHLNDGEIGIRSDLSLNTARIYDYYCAGCKEVSLGYKSQVEWAPEGADYDIVMTDILFVNHLAITALGRGGASVAIIDSLLGGLTSMKRGLFYFLSHKGKTEDASTPFSKKVFDAIEQMKGKTEEEAKKIAAPLFDSLAMMKDSDNKSCLLDVVADCFKVPKTVELNRESVATCLDSLFRSVETDTLKDLASITDSADDQSKDDDKKADDKAKDEKAKGDKKSDDADMKDSTDGKGTGTADVSDSSLDARITKLLDSAFADIDKKLDALVSAKLGLKVEAPKGGSVDLTDSAAAVTGDYSVEDILDR